MLYLPVLWSFEKQRKTLWCFFISSRFWKYFFCYFTPQTITIFFIKVSRGQNHQNWAGREQAPLQDSDQGRNERSGKLQERSVHTDTVGQVGKYLRAVSSSFSWHHSPYTNMTSYSLCTMQSEFYTEPTGLWFMLLKMEWCQSHEVHMYIISFNAARLLKKLLSFPKIFSKCSTQKPPFCT